MSGVEFLPEGGGDELPELAEPERAPTRRPSRLRPAARIAVAVVAAAGLAGWIATRPSDPSPGPAHAQAASTTPSPTSTPTSTPTVTGPPGSSVPSWSTRFVTLVRCSPGVPVRHDIARALHRFLPGIAINPKHEVRCVTGAENHPKVVSESVAGRYGKISIEVALSRRDAEFPMTFTFIGGGERRTKPHPVMLGGVETESAGIKIRISSTGDGHTKPPSARIQQLADYLSLNTVL